MAAEVSFEPSAYQPVPKKFEAGSPAFEEIATSGTLLDYLQKMNMVKTAAYEQELMKYPRSAIIETFGFGCFAACFTLLL